MNEEFMNSGHMYVPFPLACTCWHKNKQLRHSFCSCVRKHLCMGLSFQGGLFDFHQKIPQRHFNVLRSLLLKIMRGATIFERYMWWSCETIKNDIPLNGFRFPIWLKQLVTASVAIYAFLLAYMKLVCYLSNLHWANSHTVKADDINQHPPILARLPSLAGRLGPELGKQSKCYYFSQTDCLSGRGFECIVRAISGHLCLPAWTSAVNWRRTSVSKDVIPVLLQNTGYPIRRRQIDSW